jgi:hypothetical protein
VSRNRPKGYRPRGHGRIDPMPKPEVASQSIFQILISGFVAYNPSFQLSVSYEGKKMTTTEVPPRSFFETLFWFAKSSAIRKPYRCAREVSYDGRNRRLQNGSWICGNCESPR